MAVGKAGVFGVLVGIVRFVLEGIGLRAVLVGIVRFVLEGLGLRATIRP